MADTIAERIECLQRDICETAEKAGRDPAAIGLLLVTKWIEPGRIREAYDAGLRCFGENRVQELVAKKKDLPDDMRWHMIGRLQTNKVKGVLGEAEMIQSLDRPELAREIEKQAKAKRISEVFCLIEVNSSGEATKAGLPMAGVRGFVDVLAEYPSIKVKGLMTIGPLTEDERVVRESFRGMRRLRDDLRQEFPQKDWGILSMGMSADYRIAIEEGADLLRVGSLVFGPREIPRTGQ